jgi:uncharacterized membrane protein YccC
VVSQALHLRLTLWAVLTAVIVTQLSVGRSLKATTDYLVGTLGGALFAGITGAMIPHDNEFALAFVLAITLVPVALVAAANARFSAAPFTAVIVLLAPTITHLGPITSAFERVVEVVVGCVVGLAVSFMVLPARTYDLAIEAAGQLLDLMAQELPNLLGGLTASQDSAMLRVGEKIGETFAKAQANAVEGSHERATYLPFAPDPETLLRTLLRLRQNFVMIGRVALAPLPSSVQAQLKPGIDSLGHMAAAYMHASRRSLVKRQHGAPRQALDATLDNFAAEIAALNQHDLTRDLPADAVEHIFTLAFALEQLRRNFSDLEHSITEIAKSGSRKP